ncbi:MAG: hypothetical protein ACI8UD_000028 [Planctomycetota bacterium]
MLFALFLLAPWWNPLCALLVKNRALQPVDMRVPAPRFLRWPLLVSGWSWVIASLLLPTEDRGKKVDSERRSLVLNGAWGDKQLELHVVEKRFRLQTGFRLRQELPDYW